MGRPPRVRRSLSVSAATTAANRSRFCEGSMNDRTSAAPPAKFLGPQEREELEFSTLRTQPSRPVSDDFTGQQVRRGRLLGQVWDGVRGRLKLRRDATAEEDSKASKKRSKSAKRPAEDLPPIRGVSSREEKPREEKTREERLREEARRPDMPTREEILANYHSLVASGFFSSHAIQSTRQPAPGSTPTQATNTAAQSRTSTPQPPATSRATPTPTPRTQTPSAQPASSSATTRAPPVPGKLRRGFGADAPQAATFEQLVAAGFFSPPKIGEVRRPSPALSSSSAPAPAVPYMRSSREYLRPQKPQWAPSRSGTPYSSSSRAPSPLDSSVSAASSRGTKRAAVVDIPSDDDDEDGDDEELDRDPPTPKKKLRKTASREIAMPKVRNTPRRPARERRSVSGPQGIGREYNRLARRVLGRLPGANARGSVDLPDHRAAPAPRRSLSGEVKHPLQETIHPRALRQRRYMAEPLGSSNGGNRGVPKVPIIPEKYTAQSENTENEAPPRRLRRV